MKPEWPHNETTISTVRQFIAEARSAGKVTGVEGKLGWFQTTVDPNSTLAQGAAILNAHEEIEVQAQWPEENTEEESSPLALNEDDYTKWLASRDKTPVIVKWSSKFEHGE